MKSTGYGLSGVMRALFLLLFLFGSAGLMTGCGGSGSEDEATNGEGGATGAAIEYTVAGEFALTGTDAKSLLFTFDRDMQGVFDERYVAVTDASGNRIPVELIWLNARTVRIAAPLRFAASYNVAFYTTPLQASASVSKDDAAPAALLSVDFTTGHNPRDVDGDEMADVALINSIFSPTSGFFTPAAFILAGSELVANALIGEEHSLSRGTGWWRRHAPSELDDQDNPRDRIARISSIVGDINADGHAEFAVGERDYDPDLMEFRDRLLIYSGADPSAPIASFPGGSEMLSSILEVLPAGDVDGDGIADMLVSAREVKKDAAYILGIFKGRAGLAGEIPWEMGSFFAILMGDGRVDSIATLRDFNGDGINDLAVSLSKVVEPKKSIVVDPMAVVFEPAGVQLFLGSADPAAFAAPDLTITGAEERFGASIAGGDVNGDNLSDLLIGAPMALSTDGSGHAYLMPGSPAVADRTTEEAALVLSLPDDDEGAYTFGTSVGIANLSSPAYADMLVGAPEKNRVLLFTGGAAPDATADALLFNNLREGFRSEGKLMGALGQAGPVPFKRLGIELMNLGDADNDGYEDVMAAGSAAIVREVCEYPVIGYAGNISFQITINAGDQASCLGTLDQVEAMTQGCLGGVTDCTVQSSCVRAQYQYWDPLFGMTSAACTPAGWGVCANYYGYDPTGNYYFSGGNSYSITLAQVADDATCWDSLNAATSAIQALSTPTVTVSTWSYGCNPAYAKEKVCEDVDDPQTRNQRFGCVFSGDPNLGEGNRRMSCTGSDAVIKDFTNTRAGGGK